LDLLARREHSRLELERKLSAREYAEEEITAALDELEHAGLLDTERFAASFLRARIARGQGPWRILKELAERGIDEALCCDLIGRAEVDWESEARKVRAKRFGPAVPAAYAERAKQARFLHYRGFERPQIDAALDLDGVSD
jgi:regulatory protein